MTTDAATSFPASARSPSRQAPLSMRVFHPEVSEAPPPSSTPSPRPTRAVFGSRLLVHLRHPASVLTPRLTGALAMTDAHRFVLNSPRQRGETDTMSTADHVRVLREYAPVSPQLTSLSPTPPPVMTLTMKRRTKTEIKTAVPSCHGRY